MIDRKRYLRSFAWRTRRDRRINLAGGRCEYRPVTLNRGDYILRGDRCTATTELQVHHLHYESLGHEADSDLMVVCNRHHLVLTLLDWSCEFCGMELVYHETDAQAMVDNAYESFDPAPDQMTVRDVLEWGTWREAGLCDYCDDMLSKD